MAGSAPRARCSMPGPPWPRLRALLRLLLRDLERPLLSPRPRDWARGAALLPLAVVAVVAVLAVLAPLMFLLLPRTPPL